MRSRVSNPILRMVPLPLRMAVLCFLLALSAGAAWAFGTTSGSAAVFHAVAGRALQAEKVAAVSFEGRLAGTLRISELEAVHSARLGGATLRADQAVIRLADLGFGGIHVDLTNAQIEPATSSLGRFEAAQILYRPEGITVSELSWSGSDRLPAEYGLRVQQAAFLPPFDPEDIRFIRNGRVQESGQTILLFGAEQLKSEARTHLEIFSPSLDLSEVSRMVPLPARMVHLNGELKELNLNAAGDRKSDVWAVSGSALLADLRYQGFKLTDCRLSLDEFKLRKSETGWSVDGGLVFEGGKLTRNQTRLDIEAGAVTFTPQASARIKLKASSQIDDVTIRLQLTGTLDDPEVKVSSSPPLPEQRLYLMLFTGRSWRGLDASAREGRVSASLAGEMADYLFFGGSGRKTAKLLGVKDWSVTTDEKFTEAIVTQSISKKIDLKYGVQKPKAASEPVAGIAGVDYQLTTDTTVSVEGKKSTAPASDQDQGSGKAAASGTDVLLSLKNKF